MKNCKYEQGNSRNKYIRCTLDNSVRNTEKSCGYFCPKYKKSFWKKISEWFRGY